MILAMSDGIAHEIATSLEIVKAAQPLMKVRKQHTHHIRCSKAKILNNHLYSRLAFFILRIFKDNFAYFLAT